MGTEPEWQVPFFKTGCSIWFLKNVCTSFITTSINFPAYSMVPNDSKKVFIGYVGHWSSAYDLQKYLNEQILPLSNVSAIESISVDNTACYSMSPPEAIKTWLTESLDLFKNKQLSIRGNQTLSIGMQDPFFMGGKGNFWASVDSESDAIHYPRCAEFENKQCTSDQFQKNAFGICIDKISGNPKELRCRRFSWEMPSDKRNQTQTVYRWSD